jgi:hypothetical protein
MKARDYQFWAALGVTGVVAWWFIRENDRLAPAQTLPITSIGNAEAVLVRQMRALGYPRYATVGNPAGQDPSALRTVAARGGFTGAIHNETQYVAAITAVDRVYRRDVLRLAV